MKRGFKPRFEGICGAEPTPPQVAVVGHCHQTVSQRRMALQVYLDCQQLSPSYRLLTSNVCPTLAEQTWAQYLYNIKTSRNRILQVNIPCLELHHFLFAGNGLVLQGTFGSQQISQQ